MTPSARLRKAVRAPTSARLLARDGDHEGACNRAYYAMFDAAHAAFIPTGERFDPRATKTHRGLIVTFGQTLIQSGQLPAELGRSLNRIERVRLLADYTGEATDAQTTQQAIDEAFRFVDAIRIRFNIAE